MPKPNCYFDVPPIVLEFNASILKIISVNICPLSDQSFHVIFSLDGASSYFLTANGNQKTLEVVINPAAQNAYSTVIYDFDVTMTKNTASDIYTNMHAMIISQAGRSLEDSIPVIIHS